MRWAGKSIWVDLRVWNFVDDQLPTWVFIDDVQLLPTRGRVISLPLIWEKTPAGAAASEPLAATPLANLPLLGSSWPAQGPASAEIKARK